MAKTVLITGFQPFLEFKRNPSQVLADDLNGKEEDGIRYVGRVMPVSYGGIEEAMVSSITEIKPDLIIGTGLSAGRSKLSVEKIAANYKFSMEPDNDGNKGAGEKIDESQPDGLFSLLHVEDLVRKLNEKSIPTQLSMTAGAYICNYAMFIIIREARKLGISGGFVHLPADTALAASMSNKGYASMGIESMKDGIRTIASHELQV